jgi:hypothetical protein
LKKWENKEWRPRNQERKLDNKRRLRVRHKKRKRWKQTKKEENDDWKSK